MLRVLNAWHLYFLSLLGRGRLSSLYVLYFRQRLPLGRAGVTARARRAREFPRFQGLPSAGVETGKTFSSFSFGQPSRKRSRKAPAAPADRTTVNSQTLRRREFSGFHFRRAQTQIPRRAAKPEVPGASGSAAAHR